MLGLDRRSLERLRQRTAPRSAGASVYFAAALILGPTTLFLAVASLELQELGFTVAAVVSGAIALWSFQHALRHDPCSGASLCVILGLLGSLAGWVGISLGSSWVSWMLSIGSLVTTTMSVGYLVWRHLGREEAPDLLDGESVYESGGVAVHWRVREHTVQAGRLAWVEVRLQNAWRSRVRTEITLRKLGRRSPLVLPVRVLGTLESGEVGTLEIPVASRSAGSGQAHVAIEVRARPQHRWRGRLRLRPKPPFPVGPVWVLDVMAIVAQELATYGSASLELNVEAAPGPDPAEPEPVEGPRWTRQWIAEVATPATPWTST